MYMHRGMNGNIFSKNVTLLNRVLILSSGLSWESEDAITFQDERTARSSISSGAPSSDSLPTPRPVFFLHPTTASPSHREQDIFR